MLPRAADGCCGHLARASDKCSGVSIDQLSSRLSAGDVARVGI